MGDVCYLLQRNQGTTQTKLYMCYHESLSGSILCAVKKLVPETVIAILEDLPSLPEELIKMESSEECTKYIEKRLFNHTSVFF